MINRYWRSFPWILQFSLFLLTIFTLYSFCGYLVLSQVPKLSHLPLKELLELNPASTIHAIRTALFVQGAVHFGTFALPGILFAVFTHPRVREYLGLHMPGKWIHWLLVTGLIVGLIPMMIWAENWSAQHLYFGKWAENLQSVNDNELGAFLRLHSTGDLLAVVFTLAILPAVGEEFIFRGIMMRLLHRRVTMPVRFGNEEIPVRQRDPQRAMLFPVLMTSLLFAMMHPNPHGALFIFISGCVLAYIYFLTGSLLCSIWAHFVFNGTQVLLTFLQDAPATTAHTAAANTNLPAYLPLAGLILFVSCFYSLVKTQTPLPADWSDDFRVEKLQAPQPDDNSIFY